MTKITTLDQLVDEWGDGSFFRAWDDAACGSKEVPDLPTMRGGPDREDEEVDFGTGVGHNGCGPDRFDIKSLIAFFKEWDKTEDSKSNSKKIEAVIKWLKTISDDQLLQILLKSHPEGDLTKGD